MNFDRAFDRLIANEGGYVTIDTIKPAEDT